MARAGYAGLIAVFAVVFAACGGGPSTPPGAIIATEDPGNAPSTPTSSASSTSQDKPTLPLATPEVLTPVLCQPDPNAPSSRDFAINHDEHCLVWRSPVREPQGFLIELTYALSGEHFEYTVSSASREFFFPEQDHWGDTLAAQAACSPRRGFEIKVWAGLKDGSSQIVTALTHGASTCE